MKFFRKKEKIKSNKGIVLLFAIILTSIIFSIALGLISLSLKEIEFSTSASATNEAFFSADSGLECALYYDYHLISVNGADLVNPFNDESTYTLTCGGAEDVSLTYIAEIPEIQEITAKEFTLYNLGDNGQGCAYVVFTKTTTTDETGAITETNNIISKGYNLGGNATCQSSSSRLVEREIEVNY